MSFLRSLFVSSLLLYVVLEASITVRENSKKLSNSQIKKALNEAHLENHGYKKLVTQETSKDSRGRLSYSKITSFIHKEVPCSNASQIVQDTESLLLNNPKDTMTEIVLHKMVDGVKKKMGTQDTNRRLCKIELDLKTTQIAPPTSRPKRWLFDVDIDISISIEIKDGDAK
ncbi:PREDICTED: uncharacterized protein LOC107352560 [Acropora digitifera]|uniref:uncharacterized protein LOC107352560 n=1 Tax=Acropora digitifera TaxID=70779 RepID=UPI00077A8D4C|nr:PREDICTED: uncharacterized protein LOC107352560 [Acropora digitifera]